MIQSIFQQFELFSILVTDVGLVHISKSDGHSWREEGFAAEPTCNHKLQAERVLSCSVRGYTRVDAGISRCDGLYDQRVHPVLTYKHLVSAVGADWLSI